MYVLVSGNQDCPPYKSMVYGLLNTGCYEQAIVIKPYEKCFLLMDYLNKDTRQLTPGINASIPARMDGLPVKRPFC